MLTSRPHVLFLQATTNLGGSKRSLLESIEALSGTRFRPLVACGPTGWLTEQLDRLQVPHLTLPFYSWRKWLERFRVKPSLQRVWGPALAHWRLALVHSNEFWAAPQAILLGQQCHLPAVVHLRDGHHTLEKALQYRLDRAQAILAVSQALRDQFQRDSSLTAKVRVLYNGHAEYRLTPASAHEARAALGVGPDEFVMGNAGELCPRKNQKLLLLSAAQLRERGRLRAFKLILAGPAEPAYEQELRQLAAELNLLPNIVWLGVVKDMARFYAAIDVLVHCALREGLARVLPEAMLAGKPVVATMAEGVRDAIPDERYGVIAQAEPAALAEALEGLHANQAKRFAITTAAQERARVLFSVPAYRRNLVEFYEELLARAPAKPSSSTTAS